MIKSSSAAAVLDLTHGGVAIARKLIKFAGSVTAIDVYKTLTPEVMTGLENEGIRTSQDALKAGDFDVLVAPVHLDSSYPMLVEAVNSNIPVLSHHVAVGLILSEYDLMGKTIIEITGTKAKTSSAVLISEILSREKKVVSHTSQGVKDWNDNKIIKKGLSITPASILTALDAIGEAGIEPEIFIFEISLGGTGRADIGVITTIASDYSIANNTGKASEAKRQMIINAKQGSSIVINNDALRAFGACRRDVNIISFSDSINASCSVYYEDISSRGGTISYYLNNNQGRIHIPEAPEYDTTSYMTAFVCATAVALAMGIDENIIERTIREFRGTEGRMKLVPVSKRTLIDSSNSGMDIRTAEKALLFSNNLFVKKPDRRTVMVLGEEAKEVCEGLDPSAVLRFIDEHLGELEALILVGERMQGFIAANIYYADDLSRGIELAIKLTHESDIILSCVKCFR